MLGQISFNNMCQLPQTIVFKHEGREYKRRTKMNMVNNKCYVKFQGEYFEVPKDLNVVNIINK